jgi:hypothetical protein
MLILNKLSNWCAPVLVTLMLRRWCRSSWLANRPTSRCCRTSANWKANMSSWKLAMRRKSRYCMTYKLKMTTKRSLAMLTPELRTELWPMSSNSTSTITSRRQSTSGWVRNSTSCTCTLICWSKGKRKFSWLTIKLVGGAPVLAEN